ncbi:MAG: S41 family peptidase [Alistipes sp.]|nr:S41 family peptidase [Alistipes senegalensis]MCM1249551.1 S41 family peptidase [Alistipes sp.]
MKIIRIALSLLLAASSLGVRAEEPDTLQVSSIRIADRCFAILDTRMPRARVGRKLHTIPNHPGLDSLLTPAERAEVLAEIAARCDALGKDSLLTSDLFWVMRPYYDRLRHEDPHYRITMVNYGDSEVYRKKSDQRRIGRELRMPAFSLLQIRDTLLIDRSLDPQFRRGDRVMAINGVAAAQYLKYGYGDRYTTPSAMMVRYYYSQITDKFRIDLLRDGEALTVETAGQPATKTHFLLAKAEETDANIRTYPNAGSGYIAIPKFFPDNSRLIRIVRRAIEDFKKQGLRNVILDLRRNPGGNGHAFDELLSIFIDKPVAEYCTGQRVKASKEAMRYYDFLTEEQLGQVVELPETEYVRTFETNPKMYVGGMNCYVLVSRDTGSIAASFVNMLQYHGAAQLVGEPLLHNALKYGEVLEGRMLRPSQLAETAVSMVEIDECTRRDDGYVVPDIAIPYVAADYLMGGDAMLEKLLDMLR